VTVVTIIYTNDHTPFMVFESLDVRYLGAYIVLECKTGHSSYDRNNRQKAIFTSFWIML